ncbi:RecB-like helicase [Sulfurospirillum sp. 1612]|uniref:RecB-like helicase n=1 Tax=Sulfurospirillum sp. 1612 TaxID=3094835 RepID=UPI002F959838
MLKSLALEASAGSGKTFALSVRYISLMYLGINPNKILTLTFTNKATLEMKVKIFECLKTLEHSSELHEIVKLTGLTKEKILEMQPKILKLFLNSDLKISTIDSFFASILRKFSFNIGLMPDFSIEEEFASDVLMERFLQICKKSSLYHSLVVFAQKENKSLTDIFKLFQVVYERESELDLERYAKGIQLQALRSEKILSLLEQIQEAFARNGLGEKTLQSLQVSSVDELLSKGFVGKADFEYWHYKKYADATINALHHELKHELAQYVQQKEHYVIKEISKYYSAFKKAIYEEAKKSGKLSFLDLTYRLYQLLHQEISKDFLYFRMDGNFTHLLIDEFQDTSIVQYKILEPFMQEVAAGKGAYEDRSLFIVGDIKQSIYRFRGGSKELFLYAAEQLHLSRDILETNYRSAHQVVHFVNATFAEKIKDYKAQKINPANPVGYVKVDLGDDIEAQVIANLQFLMDHDISQDDIAILCFTNKEALILKELIQQQIPGTKVTMEAKQKLIDVPIISGIIDFIFYLYFREPIYLRNFEAACAKKVDSSKMAYFNLDGDVFELICDIIEAFEIFSKEEDLLYFIEISKKFRDIEDFIFNHDTISQASLSKSTQGIRVLTIHKSKGLEFHSVVIADRIKKPKSSSHTLLFDYEGIQLKNLYLRIKGRENVDLDYARAKEQEKNAATEDLINAQYVALTRAKNNLIVCAKKKDSAFENLDLLQQEVGDIFASVPKETSPSKKETKPISPSRYGSQKQEKTEKSEVYRGDIHAIDFGLGLHYMLEILGGFDERALPEAFASLKNRYGFILKENMLQDIYNRVQMLLQDETFRTLVHEGTCYKEQPLYYQGERKQLDLLVEKDGEIIVIDYKTSRIVQEAHRNQVKHYQKALQSIYNKKCRAYLCYLRETGCELVEIAEK